MKKIIVITGASSGMGVCFAQQLAKESSDYRLKNRTDLCSDEIWIIARRESNLLEVKSKIEKEASDSGRQDSYPEVKVLALDISGQEGALKIRNEFEKFEAQNGRFKINVLVNNAGFGTYGEFANTETIREMEMVDLDCTSLTGITGFALPYMEKGSRLINTASLASYIPLGNFAVYGACKAYVLSFTVALAAELKHRGIKITALCPGPVSTEFANIASKGARKEVRNGLSPEKTVAHCLKKSRKGKLYSIMALKWKIRANGSRLISRYTGAWFTYKFCKRPSN